MGKKQLVSLAVSSMEIIYDLKYYYHPQKIPNSWSYKLNQQNKGKSS